MNLLINKTNEEIRNDKYEIVSFEEIKKEILSLKIFKRFFKYKTVELKVFDINFFQKPLISSLIIYFLGYKKIIKDKFGKYKNINFFKILMLIKKTFSDFLEIKNLLNNVNQEIDTLSRNLMLKNNLNFKKKEIVYLRVDLWFDVKAGGSVGHIAGVVNALVKYYDIKFPTSDFIPTVKDKTAQNIIRPENKYWEFKEIPSLYFNKKFFKNINRYELRNAGFIYQRYNKKA